MSRVELLNIVRMVADYQFGRGVGSELFPDDTIVEVSKRTGRPRYILSDGRLLATLRSNDGMLALTLEGGERLGMIVEWPRFRVSVEERYLPELLKMKIVRVEWVVEVDELLSPNEEVLVYTTGRKLVGVGKAQIAGQTIIGSKKGTAIKVRDLRKEVMLHKPFSDREMDLVR